MESPQPQHNVLVENQDIKKSGSRAYWIVGGFLTFAVLAILTLIKWNFEGFPLKTFLLISAGVLALYGVAGYGLSLYRRFAKPDDEARQKDDIPQARPTMQLYRQAMDMLGRREYQFRIRRVIENGIGLYGDEHSRYAVFSLVIETHKSTHWAMLINAHYPERYQILNSKTPFTQGQLSTAKQRLAHPHSAPLWETTELYNPLTGVSAKTRKPTQKKKQPEPKPEGGVQ